MQNNTKPDNFGHAARALQFDQTLSLISARCINEYARRELDVLSPSTDRESIRRSLKTIEQYRVLYDRRGDVAVPEVDYRDAIVRLVEKGDSLDAADLLRIAAGERTAAEVHKHLTAGPDEYPLLCAMAEGITPHPDLVSQIERSIDPDGGVKDKASPELASLRRQIGRSRGSLRGRSEKLTAGYGQESFPTMLGTRYVILVPRTQFHKRDGLVHSTSHKGGSVYFEPFDLVEKNNELETLIIDEGREVARILRELSDCALADAGELLANVDVMIEADMLRAKASFCRELGCSSPLCADDGEIRLAQARHPLLVRSLKEESLEVVALDLRLAPDRRVMIVTGPNAGGKTVALKTLGTAVLLFQCGVQVPGAEGARLPIFDRLMTDIGDEQSIEASLSTFTSHLRHLDRMCRTANERSLCLIDEIGDGTDPDEGAALAVATLEALIGSGAAVVATTHYGRIKTFALKSEGVMNASMAFEDAEGRPLYKLLLGIAGRSRGLETARRTGFSPSVLKSAETYVGADAFRLEAVLSDLESSHVALEQERERFNRQTRALESVIDKYTSRLAEYDVTEKEARKRAGREAEQFLLDTRREVESIVREIRESQARREVLSKTRRRLDDLLHSARKEKKQLLPKLEPVVEVAVGDRVSLNPSGDPAGLVISVENGSVTVEINNKRIKLDKEAIYQAPLEGKGPPNSVTYDVHVEPLSSTTLDVRGNRREEALEAVNRFVDRAVLSGVQEITIIHGVGEGVLARSVREILVTDLRVGSIRPGGLGEGGHGVTIVTLK
jgi:DNA mismatch repair protein MutS2